MDNNNYTGDNEIQNSQNANLSMGEESANSYSNTNVGQQYSEANSNSNAEHRMNTVSDSKENIFSEPVINKNMYSGNATDSNNSVQLDKNQYSQAVYNNQLQNQYGGQNDNQYNQSAYNNSYNNQLQNQYGGQNDNQYNQSAYNNSYNTQPQNQYGGQYNPYNNQPQNQYSNQYGQQYYNNGYGYPQPPRQEKNGLAIASLILGIFGVLLSCYVIGGILGIIGLILGLVSLSKNEDGRSLAIAGVITSGIAIFIAVIVVIIAVAAFDSSYSGYSSFY